MSKKRKLQELGGSLYLSLPSEWKNRYNLKKGSEVFYSVDQTGALIVFPDQLPERKGEEIVIEFDKYIYRNLMGAYLVGANQITIKKETAFCRKEHSQVFSMVSNLLNLEIIEEQSDKIVIQNLKADLAISKMLTRMHHLISTMFDDLIHHPTDKEILEGVVARDRLVGKFYLAMISQIRAKLTSKWSKDLSFVELLDIRLLIERMEKIGDHLKYLAHDCSKGDKIKLADLKQLSQLYACAYSAYIKKDVAQAQSFWDDEEKCIKRFKHSRHFTKMYDLIKDITDLVV